MNTWINEYILRTSHFWALVELDNDQISGLTWLEGLEDIKNRKTRNFLKTPKLAQEVGVAVFFLRRHLFS